MASKTPKTVSVRVTETHTTTIIRESVVLNVEDYPNLKGKTQEQIAEYIQKNVNAMKPTQDSSQSSLFNELFNQGVLREKITGEEINIIID